MTNDQQPIPYRIPGAPIEPETPVRSSRKRSRKGHPFITFLCTVWAISLLFIALTRFVGRWSYPCDLVGNLSCLIVLPGIVSTLVLVLMRRKKAALVCMIATAVAAWPTAALRVEPLLRTMTSTAASQPPTSQNTAKTVAQPPSSSALQQAGDTVSIIEYNVHGQTEVINRLMKLVMAKQPDVVVIIEISYGQQARSVTNDKSIRAVYPFAVEPRKGELWPFVLLSKYPMHKMSFHGDFERYKFVYAYRNSYIVDMPSGRRFILSADHPPSPRTADDWKHGNDAVSLLCEVINKYLKPADTPILIAGDFNTTPNGWRFQLMHKQSGLEPSDSVAGLSGTWPCMEYLPGFMRITLDRIWASPNVRFIDQQVLGDLGSDHLPILVHLQLPDNLTRSDIP